MRYAPYSAGDLTLKRRTPGVSVTGNGEAWKHTMSGLGDMRYDRWWEVALQIRDAQERRRGA